MANHFISFLGTNRYLECNYVFRDKKVKNVRFVQEAIVEMLEWKKGDRITILVTDEALKKNWEDNGHGDEDGEEGLRSRLNRLKEKGLKAEINYINIPEGKSEKELWEIFERILDAIQPEENLIFDITHGFRSLPLLAAVLLNYAKVLKKVNVKGVFYGAFEVLGPLYKVKDIPIEERNAPIFDLTPFFTLYDWAIGIDEFLRYGKVEGIQNLTHREITPILSRTKGQDKVASNLRKFFEKLKEISDDIYTNRGIKILSFDSQEVIKIIKDDEKSFIKPLSPVFSKVESKISGFKKEDVRNGYKAVKWCIEHGLIQQGYTILQETIITDIIINTLKMDYSVLYIRNAVSKALKIKSEDIPEDKWKVSEEEIEIVKETLDLVPKKLASIYNKLTDFRNDINHAGFLRDKSRKSEQLKRELEKIFRDFEENFL